MLGWKQNVASKTWTAIFLEFLVKTCFLPISIKEEKIVFKIFSLKTSLHFFTSLSYAILTTTLVIKFASIGFDKMFDGGGLAEVVSVTLLYLSMATGLIIPALLSAGLTSLSPDIILRNDLRLPKKAYRIFIGEEISNLTIKYNV